MGKKILLVDDEKTILDISKRYLEKEGYNVITAKNGKEALIVFKHQSIDLIITDIMMPELDGHEFMLDVLEEKEHIPFIYITAKNANQDILYSLSLGADDYLIKPFNPTELVLRVRNILRRVYNESNNIINIESLEMDYERCFAKVSGNSLELTSKEFLLLWLFASDPDKVYSRSEILSLIWKSHSINELNTVNVHIHRLREKLNKYRSFKGSPIIKTVWGTGYTLEVTK